MTDSLGVTDRLNSALIVLITVTVTLAICFTAFSFFIARGSVNSNCQSGYYYINDRPVLVDGQHLHCERLKLGRDDF